MRQLIHAISDPETNADFVARNGTNLDKFMKELICEGDFQHPEKPGVRVRMDLARMQKLKQSFEKMQAEGLHVTLPYGHSNRWNSDKHAGELLGIEIKQRPDGRYGMFGLLDIPRHDDASRIGTTVKGVSIGLDHDFKTADGAGGVKSWGEVLDHVALTNDPVVHQTSGFEPVEVDVPQEVASAFGVEKAFHGTITGLSRVEPEISKAPWSTVDRDRLPASCFLSVEDPGDRRTWKLPIYEAEGALVDGPGGTKLLSARGAISLDAMREAAASLSREDSNLGPDLRKTLARQLSRLFVEHDLDRPPELLEATGRRLKLFDELEDVPTVKDLLAEEELRDLTWSGLYALQEVIERVLHSEAFSSEEKRTRLLDAVDQFRDVFGQVTNEQLEKVKAELTAAFDLPPEVRDDKQGTSLPEDEMKLADLKNLKPLAEKLGVSIADDADAAAMDTLLEQALEGVAKGAELGREPEETPREKQYRERLENLERQDRVRAVKDGSAFSRSLQTQGAITGPQSKLLDKILSADLTEARVATLSMEGSKETLNEEETDVRSLVMEFARGIPAGAVTGRRTVVTEPRDGEDDATAKDKAVKSLLSKVGANPETGVVGGG